MKVHVLEAAGGGRYRVALHAPMPAGNNAIGVSWKNAYIAAGLNVTILPEGTGTGQITAAERVQILAGDVIEIVAEIEEPPPGAPGAATVTEMADKVISERLILLQTRLKFYGYTQAT